MTATPILDQNILFDLSQSMIPWDIVDGEYLTEPQPWRIGDLLRFILIVGPVTSNIDVAKFILN
jgi:Mg2+-importing ATPase